MQYIDTSLIVIPDYRIRKEFDLEALNELSESILSKGLMHAIVLREDGQTLVAGERRLRAIKDIYFLTDQSFKYNGEEVPKGMVPFIYLSDLSPLEHEEAELEENVKRVNLSWQEEAAAIARIADLRKRQAAAAGAPPPSLREIAVSIDQPEGNASIINTKMMVSKHLSDPDVAKAKSLQEAHKVIKRKQQAKRNEDLARVVGSTFTSASHQLFNEDSLEWLTASPDAYYDVILTDPPYGMGADEFGDSGGLAAGAHGYTDSREAFDQIMDVLAFQSFRITKPQAHLYWFCDIDARYEISHRLRQAGWNVFRTPLIWFKPNGSRTPWVDKGPQRKYEMCIFASKGDKLVQKIAGDVLTFPSDENLGHAAQKPVALFEELLKRSCVPGDRVLDPFCGTGPIFPAAHGLKVIATGVEIDPSFYGIAVNRIKELP